MYIYYMYVLISILWVYEYLCLQNCKTFFTFTAHGDDVICIHHTSVAPSSARAARARLLPLRRLFLCSP